MPAYEPTRFQLNADDFVAANQAHLRRQLLRPERPWERWAFVLLIVLVLVLSTIVALLGDSSTLISTVAGLATLALLGVVVYRWVVPATARRNFRSTAAFARETEFSWDRDGFQVMSTHEAAVVPWSEVTFARRTPEALLLYRSPRAHHIIPLRSLAGGEADAIVTAHRVATQSS